ncbi:MAG: hypothetical protein E6I72_05990 [Chloroflexi bacterium]|nr:MAG: hypothetical protein E6I72_05990 [Chloroflexota bacterium]
MRRLSLACGLALVVLAFAAASRVSDTREGQVAEVVTLLGGLAGIGLLTYAFASRPRATSSSSSSTSPVTRTPAMGGRRRSSRDLVLGAGGVVLAVCLLAGLAFSGGPLWAAFGLALLVPMIAGSVYLCLRFLRANP